MERRKFLRSLVIGSAAIVVTPAIIAEATKPKVLEWELELQKCKDDPMYFFRKYWCATDPARPGYIFTFGTAGENDPGSFKWIEPYQITMIKARRKGYNSYPMRYYEEAGKWPLLDK